MTYHCRRCGDTIDRDRSPMTSIRLPTGDGFDFITFTTCMSCSESIRDQMEYAPLEND